MTRLLLALDTSTDVTIAGLAWLRPGGPAMFAEATADAPRAAMSRILPMVDSLLSANGLSVRDVSDIVVGRGPGSFTGVRIGVATAKGLAHGLGVPLYGVGTLDAVAWRFSGYEGLLGVVGDAMRGEVYPALFRCRDGRVERQGDDRVAKPDSAARAWQALEQPLTLAGNGLRKYGDRFREALLAADVAPEALWTPAPGGLFDAFAASLAAGDAGSGDPGALLPIYTRLSDAEEAEAHRLGRSDGLPPSGVAGSGAGR